MSIKILVTEPMAEEGLQMLTRIESFQVDYEPRIKRDQLLNIVGNYQGLLIRTYSKIDAELLDHATQLKAICRLGIGTDHIDLQSCQSRQIVVMNTPAGNRNATAEMTIALMFSVARMIPQATDSIRHGRWDREHFTGVELANKTLGIVGLGNIGSRVAIKALALDMNVVAHDPYLAPELAQKINVPLQTLSEVLERSDFVSLHVPLTQETKAMANSAFFSQMKMGSYFINASRGAVVNETALAEALENNKLGGAGLDVFEMEPPVISSPLVKSDKVVLTPHTAGQSKEALIKVSIEGAMNLKEFFLNDRPQNAVLG
ncbi:MAG: hydroxyacid dehydrogenase [Oligoflexia bacterium]|nr:hydroxyacid dehydrogenase [Oligoflexia bacterium]